jgi:hypothetical protein
MTLVGGPGFEPGAPRSRTLCTSCPPVSPRFLQCPPVLNPTRSSFPLVSSCVLLVPRMRDKSVTRLIVTGLRNRGRARRSEVSRPYSPNALEIASKSPDSRVRLLICRSTESNSMRLIPAEPTGNRGGGQILRVEPRWPALPFGSPAPPGSYASPTEPSFNRLLAAAPTESSHISRIRRR